MRLVTFFCWAIVFFFSAIGVVTVTAKFACEAKHPEAKKCFITYEVVYED